VNLRKKAIEEGNRRTAIEAHKFEGCEILARDRSESQVQSFRDYNNGAGECLCKPFMLRVRESKFGLLIQHSFALMSIYRTGNHHSQIGVRRASGD
jgi:hypothetical protein